MTSSTRRHLPTPGSVIPATLPTRRALLEGPIDHVVVIGAGLSGLSATLRLLASGKKVTLLESADAVGGRCRTETLSTDHGDFEFDTGATVLTMPQLIDSALACVGMRREDIPGFELRKLSPAYAADYADGKRVHVYSDPDRMAAEISRVFGDERIVEGYRTQRAWAQRMFADSYADFLAADFDSPLDLLATPIAATRLMSLLGNGAFGALGPRVQRHLGNEDLARLFTFQALYAGQSPDSARAVYTVISHMDTSMGVYYPGHSMSDVPEALATAARRAGADLRLNTAVTSLVWDPTARRRIHGVRLANGDTILADAVIATCDLPVVDRILNAETPPDGTRFRRRRPLQWSPSAVVLHGSVPTKLAQTWPCQTHHTMSFGAAWSSTFEEITASRGKGSLMSDPSLLITRVGVDSPSRVVDGYEPLSVLAPCPNLHSAPLDWETVGPAYVQELLEELESRGYTGIRQAMSIARVDTPATWSERDGYGAGTPFSLAHSFTQTGPFRPGNFRPWGIENLVLAGAGTTPGIGVPTVVLSGALAARRITGGGVR